MTQSANARPCNCDQALEAERLLKLCQDTAADTWGMLTAKLNIELEALGSDNEALSLTCDAQRQILDTITRILCDLVSAPSLSVAEFNDPTLEQIRLAMLGRAGS